MLTSQRGRSYRHEDLCLVHVGPRASEVLHEPLGGTVRVERIWEDLIEAAHHG